MNFDRIGCISNIETDPLRQALANNPALWNVDKRRESYPGSAHANAQSIILRYCVTHSAVPTLNEILNEIECIDYPLMEVLSEAVPVIQSIMTLLLLCPANIESGIIGRAIITRLPPGGTITMHVDEGAAAAAYKRYHLPLVTSPGAMFYCGGEVVHMPADELWCFNHRLPHSVANYGNTDRIHLIVDAM